jgi:hypothetical protein
VRVSVGGALLKKMVEVAKVGGLCVGGEWGGRDGERIWREELERGAGLALARRGVLPGLLCCAPRSAAL